MVTITQLTHEMVSEYVGLTNRPGLSPAEYLQFRQAALVEIQNGLGVLSEPISIPEPDSASSKMIGMEQSVTNSGADAKPLFPDRVPNVSTPVQKSFQETSTNVSVVNEETDVSNGAEEDDAFFSIIDRLES